jgi:hypothetical protein
MLAGLPMTTLYGPLLEETKYEEFLEILPGGIISWT